MLATIADAIDVLVIDDNEDICWLLKHGLTGHGFDVVMASSGQAGVDFYRTHHAQVDLVLLDVQMSGMDGPATLAALKEIDPLVRVCFMSGYPGKYTVAYLLEMGAKSVYKKPFDSLKSLARSLHNIAGRLQPPSE